MNISLVKTHSGFVPADPDTERYAGKVSLGEILTGEFRKVRNPKFHRKMFALFNLAFEYWQPGEISSKYGVPEKNFDRFRKDLTILAGFYEVHHRIDGALKIEAKSLAVGSMDDNEFSMCYRAILDVVHNRILPTLPPEEIEQLADKLMCFE